MKGIGKIMAVMLLCLVTVGAFAAENKTSSDIPWMASYNKGGQVNLYASAGWDGWGIGASAGGELIISEFSIGSVPLSWGVMARGVVGFPIFYGYAGLEWGAAGLVDLHWGLDFGKSAQFDIYAGIGPGVCGTYGAPFAIGIAEYSGVCWFVDPKLAIIAENGYYNGFVLGAWISYFGVGVQYKL